MTPVLFLAFVAGLTLLVALSAVRWLPRGTAVGVIVGLALWLGYVGALSLAGVVRDPSLRPPGAVYVVGPAMLFALLGVARSDRAAKTATMIPLWWLIGVQSFRVGVELFLHQLWREGLVPRMLTFEGANLDIWVGLSAPLAAWLSTRGRAGLVAALIWNVAGLLALANVVIRSALTAPGPLHLLDAEVANRAIGTFPYTFIAGFLAPLALTLHVLALRANTGRLTASSLQASEPSRERPA